MKFVLPNQLGLLDAYYGNLKKYIGVIEIKKLKVNPYKYELKNIELINSIIDLIIQDEKPELIATQIIELIKYGKAK